MKRQLENGRTPKKRGIPRVRQYIYLTKYEKWTINSMAASENISTSAYISRLIQREIYNKPNLKLEFEKGDHDEN